MNPRHIWRTIGIALVLLGGALLAFSSANFATPMGTIFLFAGVGLAMWAWIAPINDHQSQLKQKTYDHRPKHKR